MKINDRKIDLHVFKETEFLIEGLRFVDPNDKSDFQKQYREILERYESMTPEQRARQRKWIEDHMKHRENIGVAF